MKHKAWVHWLSGHWSQNNAGKSVGKQIAICKFGMAEEMGEVMGHFKREIRGDPKPREELLAELGDVLHYIHRYMQLADIDPQEVYQINHDKLVKRYGTKS